MMLAFVLLVLMALSQDSFTVIASAPATGSLSPAITIRNLVELRTDYNHRCSGRLLSRNVVDTAAACVLPVFNNHNVTKIISHSTIIQESGIRSINFFPPDLATIELSNPFNEPEEYSRFIDGDDDDQNQQDTINVLNDDMSLNTEVFVDVACAGPPRNISITNNEAKKLVYYYNARVPLKFSKPCPALDSYKVTTSFMCAEINLSNSETPCDIDLGSPVISDGLLIGMVFKKIVDTYLVTLY